MECNCKKTVRKDADKKRLNNRLSIIEGQVRGIKEMINNDRYCDDILIQMSAIKASLDSISKDILKSHITNCVVRDLKNGDTKIIDELITTIGRL